MEKNLDTFDKIISLLYNKFDECQDSLIMVMVDWDKHIVHLVHLGENVIHLNNWKEVRLTHMLNQPQQELETNEEALKNIQAVVQGNCEARPLSISTVESNTMTKTTLLRSPSFNFSQYHVGDFEKNIEGIDSKILR